MKRSAVTLRDVAQAAGVSIATASRALSGKNRVSRSTIKRVTLAAEQLDYRANTFGRALREGTDGAVGVVVPVVSNPFYGLLVHALEEELREQALELIIADSHGQVERERERLRMLVGRQVEGIIVVPAEVEASLHAITDAARRAPLVQVDRRVDGASADFVGVDNHRGIALVLDHLEAQGARNILLVTSDDATSVGRERHEAFEREATRRGLPLQPAVRNNFTFEFGLAAAADIAFRQPRPDAIVAGDDLIAAGLMIGLKRRGFAIPDDLMVTGFDGTMLADVCDPSLTTVVQPIRQIAAEAVRALLRRTANDDGPALDLRLAPTLRIGGSTQTGVSAAVELLVQ